MIADAWEISTFSIVAYDPATGSWGIAVQSKYFGVGNACPFAEVDVGAISTQAHVNNTWGPEGLRLLGRGLSADEVVRLLTRDDKLRERKQMGIVDSRGDAATYTGSECTPWAGGRVGRGYAVQGNILEGEEVVAAMARGFEAAGGEFAERLVSALEAGQAAGGDARGQQSASLLVVRKGMYRVPHVPGSGDRYIDVRVEDHPTPIAELRRVLNMKYSYDLMQMSQVRMEEGKVEEALSLAKKAVERSPENDIAHMALCRAYHETGDTAMAIEEFQKAARINAKTLSYVRKTPRWGFLAKDERFFKGLP